MRNPVGGNILVEVDNILPAEGGSIPPVAGIRRMAGEVGANHNHHIHPVEVGIVLEEEEEYCTACVTTFLAICPRIHDYLTTTAADHTHWKK